MFSPRFPGSKSMRKQASSLSNSIACINLPTGSFGFPASTHFELPWDDAGFQISSILEPSGAELTKIFNRVCLIATMQENHSEISAHHPGNEFEYRSISKAAVASFIFAIMGGLTFLLAAHFVLLPFLAAVFGLVALGNFRRFPDEFRTDY